MTPGKLMTFAEEHLSEKAPARAPFHFLDEVLVIDACQGKNYDQKGRDLRMTKPLKQENLIME
ncbi:MAG TPA: hypothetical protein VN604_08800 [Nitrospirota bacterium]|nr:hypothetical protein [Nitrospirota bacterium]